MAVEFFQLTPRKHLALVQESLAPTTLLIPFPKPERVTTSSKFLYTYPYAEAYVAIDVFDQERDKFGLVSEYSQSMDRNYSRRGSTFAPCWLLLLSRR